MPSSTAEAPCPRCGRPRVCGATTGDCACFGLDLSPELQRELRRRWSDCLCVACLSALQRGAPFEAPQAEPARTR
ncbi:cysteine-rich CWC family protein [Inhella gelatinilytica]|uniref:Cysteine-rich CWC family protein n=1 Tax=Inhella gelatinilytica TaxID=2795030 RepID=A0A931IRD2_9BURK|nr:cysteine-rich CWC family protein [Inhella gelatinilytica]